METHENLPRYSRNTQWKDVTVNEMKRFLAIYFLTGIIKKPELSQYWRPNPLLKTPIFGEMMSRNRFQTILEFLHFSDNSNYDPNEPNRDRLFKVRPIVENLVQKFKTAYMPSQNVSIDEVLWKGRLQFKQYIPNKRSRFGIKYFSLCESTGYMWNSFVYLGKPKNISHGESQLIKELGISGSEVPKLMSELYNNGYHLYMDNWYTVKNCLNI